MQSPYKKKRRFARVQLSKQLRIRLRDVNELIDRCEGDIGLGGMFLKTRVNLPIGTQLSVSIELSEGTNTLEISARVLRLDTTEATGREGIAFEFEELPPASEIWLRNLIEQIRTSGKSSKSF